MGYVRHNYVPSGSTFYMLVYRIRIMNFCVRLKREVSRYYGSAMTAVPVYISWMS